MLTESEIAEHRKIQFAAKSVLARLGSMITPGDSERSIASKAHQMISALGYADTWYYDCPALVLLGSRSCISVSGKEYEASEEPVGDSNLVTIDLSPMHDNYWGDVACSYPIEDGRLALQPRHLEFKNGMHFLEQLHLQMTRVVHPRTTFSDLFEWTNMRIRESGFVNLDYRNNVGHSLASCCGERLFIEADNSVELGAIKFFSFEPFVRLKGGKWGFKREGVFYFNAKGQLLEL